MAALTYYMHDGPSSFRVELAGVLAGEEVRELEQAWLTASSIINDKTLVIDITFVSGLDQTGRGLLLRWHELGVRFVADSARSRMLVESITGHPFAPAGQSVGPTYEPYHGWATPRAAGLLVAAMLTLLFPTRVWSAESAQSPTSVLARYKAGLEHNDPWPGSRPLEVDIDAALPKLAKRGRLAAVRNPEFERPGYQVLRAEGDPTVEHQVIARYLSARAQAEALPPSTVAINEANYKFRFLRLMGSLYVFSIKPLKKQTGLMQGELWIDGGSGLAVHKAGRLVKRPSIFLRRVDLVQDLEIRDGVPYSRTTHFHIETLLAGRAEVTVRERSVQQMRDESDQD